MSRDPQTFLWYDLETFGLSELRHPIIQFGAVRTDANFNVLGEPINLLCQLPTDRLPDPESAGVHRISPLQLIGEGAKRNGAMRESEFAARIHREVCRPGTCSVGYNSEEFDNKHLRYLFYRNLLPPYEHEFKNNCGKWDLLNVLRLVSVLAPDTLHPAHKEDGTPSYKLEDLARANGIEIIAHDALEDTGALLRLAKIVRQHSSELFDFCLRHRGKAESVSLLRTQDPAPLLHFSSRFRGEHHGGSIILPLVRDPQQVNLFHCFDLRHSPLPFLELSAEDARERMFVKHSVAEESGISPLQGIKGLRVNHCPVFFPFDKTWTQDKINDIFARLSLDREQTRNHMRLVGKHREALCAKVLEIFGKEREFPAEGVYCSAEELLYKQFITDRDAALLAAVSGADITDIANIPNIEDTEEKISNIATDPDSFEDERLPALVAHYKGRNFPHLLTENEKAEWNSHCQKVWARDLPEIRASLKTLLADKPKEDPAYSLLLDTETYLNKITAG